MTIEIVRLSKSCEKCSYDLQEKCSKAFMNGNRLHFIHCNTDNCKLLRDLGL